MILSLIPVKYSISSSLKRLFARQIVFFISKIHTVQLTSSILPLIISGFDCSNKSHFYVRFSVEKGWGVQAESELDSRLRLLFLLKGTLIKLIVRPTAFLCYVHKQSLDCLTRFLDCRMMQFCCAIRLQLLKTKAFNLKLALV